MTQNEQLYTDFLHSCSATAAAKSKKCKIHIKRASAVKIFYYQWSMVFIKLILHAGNHAAVKAKL
jgi:hypothetical protein